MYLGFLRSTFLAITALGAGIATPATALDARQAFAFMVAAYERTADQCNYADSVRLSMARLDVQNATGDVAGWAELKASGSAALDSLEGIMPLNVDWTSCSSVGGMLADWAAIAAVSQAMEASTAALRTPAAAADEAEANVELLAQIINGDNASYAKGADWRFRSLEAETQAGCRMTAALDSTTQLIVVKRPGDQTQFGIATTNRGLLNPPTTQFSATIDGRTLNVNPPETNHGTVAWFAGRGTDLADQIRGGRLLEVKLNRWSFRLLVEGFGNHYDKLAGCSMNSLSIATPLDLFGQE